MNYILTNINKRRITISRNTHTKFELNRKGTIVLAQIHTYTFHRKNNINGFTDYLKTQVKIAY